MIVNIIKSYRDIITICDSELLGKRFEEGQFQLDIKESFYKGIEKSLEETIKIMEDFSSEDATFNIVGQKSVDAALQAGIIDQEGIKKIQDIPFAMVLM